MILFKNVASSVLRTPTGPDSKSTPNGLSGTTLFSPEGGVFSPTTVQLLKDAKGAVNPGGRGSDRSSFSKPQVINAMQRRMLELAKAHQNQHKILGAAAQKDLEIEQLGRSVIHLKDQLTHVNHQLSETKVKLEVALFKVRESEDQLGLANIDNARLEQSAKGAEKNVVALKSALQDMVAAKEIDLNRNGAAAKEGLEKQLVEAEQDALKLRKQLSDKQEWIESQESKIEALTLKGNELVAAKFTLVTKISILEGKVKKSDRSVSLLAHENKQYKEINSQVQSELSAAYAFIISIIQDADGHILDEFKALITTDPVLSKAFSPVKRTIQPYQHVENSATDQQIDEVSTFDRLATVSKTSLPTIQETSFDELDSVSATPFKGIATEVAPLHSDLDGVEKKFGDEVVNHLDSTREDDESSSNASELVTTHAGSLSAIEPRKPAKKIKSKKLTGGGFTLGEESES
jgi:hypothetical protein